MELENLTFYTISSKVLGKKSGIYKLSGGGHIYIGSSKNLYARLAEHRHDLDRGEHSNTFLQRVCNKVGIDKMRVDIIEYCDPDIRLEREKYWIDELQADMNMQDPVDHTLSEESRKKLSDSVKKGLAEGKYKTKFHFCEVEAYDIYGNFITKFKNKQDAADKLHVDVKNIMRVARGYQKGSILRPIGYRLRYADSRVPVQKFTPNMNYVGAYYDFYYIDENGDEQLAFHDVRSVWKFIAEHVTDEKITIYPRLKAKCRESGNLLCDEDNPNPSAPEME